MLTRKTIGIELEGETYTVKEPTGSQLQEIFDVQESGKRIEAAFLTMRYTLHNAEGRVFSDTESLDDVSPSIAMQITQAAMALVNPKKE